MYYSILEEDKDGRFDCFVFNSVHGHILQSFAWASVKRCWKPFGVVVEEDGEICASMLVLKRDIPFLRCSMFYAPRGPIWDGWREDVLQCLLQGVHTLAKQERAYVLRLDPDVSQDNMVFRAVMKKRGFILLADAKNLEHIQAQHLMRIDLVGKTKQQVLDAFKPKTRYNVRLAQRHGVHVVKGSADDLDDFYELMRQTGNRDGFSIRSKTYFALILQRLGQHAALFLAKDASDVPLAGAICVHAAGKMLYLYGASADQKRNLMPTYLLQWEMICYAMDLGCRLYDLRGVPKEPQTSPLQGLYRFKSGFGAKREDLVGEYHYIYRSFAYKVLETVLPIARRILCKIKRN